MRILLFLHELALGGTSVNSVELAAALRRRHGHDVTLFATPGPMLSLVRKLKVPYVEAPAAHVHPSLCRMRALRSAVQSLKPDLLYVWETWPCIDAYYGVHVPWRIPMLVTDMQTTVAKVQPRSIPVTYGMPELADRARKAGIKQAHVLLPPIDLESNAPTAADGQSLRFEYGISPKEFVVVTVSRLVDSLKGESLQRTIRAVSMLGDSVPIRFLLVGDGTARQKLQCQADSVNAALGRQAIILTGSLTDPRRAYAAADITIGMATSALRAMAFGKPTIIVGDDGFSELFTPQTKQSIAYKGIWGSGINGHSTDRLPAQIDLLARDEAMRQSLARFGYEFVHEYFGLDDISDQLHALCVETASRPISIAETVVDGMRSAFMYFRERRFMWRGLPLQRFRVS